MPEYDDPRVVREGAWAIIRDRRGMSASGHERAVTWAGGYVDAQRPPLPGGEVPPRIRPGARTMLSPEDLAYAEKVGKGQHKASGARGTRGAGADLTKRVQGAIGEVAVARLLGIEPQARVMHGPEAAGSCDLIYQDLCIEVKAGLPLVHVDAFRPGVLYVSVKVEGSTVTVRHAMYGRAFAGRRPPAWATPRPGTNEKNVWFGA